MLFTKIKKKKLIINYITKNLDNAVRKRNKLHWNLLQGYKLILSSKENRNFVFITKNDQSKLSFYYNDYSLTYFENQLSTKELKQILGE